MKKSLVLGLVLLGLFLVSCQYENGKLTLDFGSVKQSGGFEENETNPQVAEDIISDFKKIFNNPSDYIDKQISIRGTLEYASRICFYPDGSARYILRDNDGYFIHVDLNEPNRKFSAHEVYTLTGIFIHVLDSGRDCYIVTHNG